MTYEPDCLEYTGSEALENIRTMIDYIKTNEKIHFEEGFLEKPESRNNHIYRAAIIAERAMDSKGGFWIATVRVIPEDEEDEKQEEEAMEYEYPDYDIIMDFIAEQGDFMDFKYEGNAFCVESQTKKSIEELHSFIQKIVPKKKIGIEWGYWIDEN